ncbi:MAG: site-specific integrase [Verrucomicrobiaceae bacterium]|nr:MAG: site-specific integrase [Verrucomicrobiaceae bacterium]
MKQALETITVKGASVTIYSTPTKKNGRKYPGHTLVYTAAGKRNRKFVSAFDAAKKTAKAIAEQLSEGTGHVHSLTPQEVAEYTTAVRLLRQHPEATLTGVVAEWAQSQTALGTRGNLSDAVSTFLRVSAETKLPTITVAGILTRFMDAKSREGLTSFYLDDIERKLKRFSNSFRCNIGSIQPEEIAQWLTKQGGGRNANNIRASVATLFGFARDHGFLPRDKKHAAELVKKLKEKVSPIGIYTPDDLHAILAVAEKRFLPSLAIAALAGLRVTEVFRLEWEDVKIDRKHIVVEASKSKTASRRIVPILPALEQWLVPYVKKVGHVAPEYHNLENISRVFTAACEAAGVTPQRNGFRHSFASYRLAAVKSADQVALEMGNSPRKLFENYRELVTEEDAQDWFDVAPGAIPPAQKRKERAKAKAKKAIPMPRRAA